ncbi:MAG: cytochrome B [Cytophagales bacterium]
MYQILLYAHSYSRWFVLATLIFAIYQAANGIISKRPFEKRDKMAALLGLIFTHSQFVVGLILYFQSAVVQLFLNDVKAGMKISALRYWGMEHIATMTIAVILITIGYSISKRRAENNKKFQYILVFYGIGLLLILSSIPWAGANARPLFRM